MKKVGKKIILTVLVLTFFSTELFTQTRKFGLKDENSTSASKNDSPKIELSQNQICNVYALDYSPDGKHLVAGYNNGSVRIWDITTGKMERDLQGHTGVVWSVAYSPDGKMVISGSADKTIKCWDANTGKLIRTLPKKGDEGHSAIVSYVTFNPSGTYIASGSSDKSVKFWDASTGQLLQTLSNTHSKTIAAISYSKTGRYVATASWDNTTKIYHAMGGIERNLLTGHKEAVFAVQFSPDEKYIATGSADKTVRIYEVETGNFVRSITGLSGEVWTLSYTPDGKNIVIGASDGSVILFDVATGKTKMQFSGHDHEVRSCAFDKQGKHLYTGDSGGIIKMWDVEKGELLVTMLQITDGNWVTWTPDGFLTGSEGSFSKLSYTYNNKKYSLEEIKSTVNRPDIIAAKMKDEVIPNYSEQDTFAAIVARDSEPEIQFEILNADNSKRTDNRNRDINVKMKIKDTGSGIGNIYLKLNGRAFLVTEGRSSNIGKIHNINSSTPLSLRKGKNTISVSVFDSTNKKEHQSAQMEVEWFGNVQKSRLFVLAAGVDSYTDKTVANLSGCVNDAKAFAETSRLYAGDLYMNIFEKVLVDGAVTRQNLLKVIKDFGNSVQPDDVFILYLAGHGITHTDGDYYFIPADFKNNGTNPVENSGVSKWDIINALSSIRAENVTVILDTCNSASFGSKQPSEKELLSMSKQAIVERMGALSGFDLIAACTSTQVAVDNFNGHGVFTACLLDGIKGAADLDQNGQITSAELATYVIKEVPIQSNKKFGYKQEPQRSQPKFDFPMFGKLNPLEGQSIKEAMEIAKLVREKGIDLENATTQVSNSDVAKGSIIEEPETKKFFNTTKKSNPHGTKYTIEDFATKRVKWNEVPFEYIEELLVYKNEYVNTNWNTFWVDTVKKWPNQSEESFMAAINGFEGDTLTEYTIEAWVELIRYYYNLYPNRLIRDENYKAPAKKTDTSSTKTTTTASTNNSSYSSDTSLYALDMYWNIDFGGIADFENDKKGTSFGIRYFLLSLYPEFIFSEATLTYYGLSDFPDYLDLTVWTGFTYKFSDIFIPYIVGGLGFYVGDDYCGLSLGIKAGAEFIMSDVVSFGACYTFSNFTFSSHVHGITLSVGINGEDLWNCCCSWW